MQCRLLLFVNDIKYMYKMPDDYTFVYALHLIPDTDVQCCGFELADNRKTKVILTVHKISQNVQYRRDVCSVKAYMTDI